MQQQNLSSRSANCTRFLPCANEPARRIGSDISRGGQVFVRCIEFNTLGDFLADALTKATEYGRKLLSRALGTLGSMRSDIPRDIFHINDVCVFKQLRKAAREATNGWAIPLQYNTVPHCFRADEVIRRSRHKRRSAKDMAWRNRFQD